MAGAPVHRVLAAAAAWVAAGTDGAAQATRTDRERMLRWRLRVRSLVTGHGDLRKAARAAAQRVRIVRGLLFAVAVAASIAGALAWSARPGWGQPFGSRHQLVFSGAAFRAVSGVAETAGSGLRVESAGPTQTALQTVILSGIAAERYPVLRYRFSGLPRTRELAFVFRRADQPGDVKTVTLPWPGSGTATFDLSRVADWRGRIIELGFAEYPTPQTMPPEPPGYSAFVLDQAGLWSPSWRGALAALATDWLATWPWSQRSVHALGRDTGTPRQRSVVFGAALAAGLLLLCLRLLGVRGRALAIAAAWTVGAAWLLLDLRWQGDLLGRLAATRAVYAHYPLAERQNHIADDELRIDAQQIGALLAAEPADTRILIRSSIGYSFRSLRLVWHLLPRNAIPYSIAVAAGQPLPPGTIIMLDGPQHWRADPYLARAHLLGAPDTLFDGDFEPHAFTLLRIGKRHGS